MCAVVCSFPPNLLFHMHARISSFSQSLTFARVRTPMSGRLEQDGVPHR